MITNCFSSEIFKNHKKLIIFVAVSVLLVTIAIILYFILRPRPPGAVSANSYLCAHAGVGILRKGGSAVDAAIATLFCDGVVCPQSMGIGGGFLMTIYSRSNRKAWTLNARETAPAKSNKDMFNGDSEVSQNGGLAIAVPGELKGYWEAFNRFGSGYVKWSELVEPSIKICENGFRVTRYLAEVLKTEEKRIAKSKTLSELLVNPITGHIWQFGDLIKNPKLGKTLRKIAENGVDIFYSGTMGDSLVNDIKDFGGIMTKDDLMNYKVRWEEPVRTTLSDGMELYTAPLPGSGALVAFMFNVLDPFIPKKNVVDELTYQRIVETFKYAYAQRTEMGDPWFNRSLFHLTTDVTSKAFANTVRANIMDKKTSQDPLHYGAIFSRFKGHGTAHVSVLDSNGDAVSVTSTINLLFGAKVVSPSTGIILNDEMDDFSSPNITNAFGLPPSPANFIVPGKRPMSSMCPSIFVDSYGDVRLVVGAAGGTKITTGTAQVAMYNLWFNQSIKEAINKKRIHHQLVPMELQTEEGFNEVIAQALEKIGHKITHFPPTKGSSVTGIAVQDGAVYASGDSRKNGSGMVQS